MAEEIIFPNKIRIIRKLRGIKMSDLAKFLDISLSAVSKIEKGYRRIDQEQLLKICEFLNCSLQDIFISDEEESSVSDAWKEETERRQNLNEYSGLKTFGAGLRYIRNQKNMTLTEVAEQSGMTLSVYHRIEMGQREISEDELYSIAKTFGMTTNELLVKIYELNESGALEKYNQNTIVNSVNSSSNPSNILKVASSPFVSKMLSLSTNKNIPLYGKAGSNGEIIINKEESTNIESPLKETPKDLYAVKLATRRLTNIIPNRAVLFVNPNESAAVGDLAVLYDTDKDKEEKKIKIVLVKEDEKGKLYGMIYNPDEKLKIDENKIHLLHKIIFIQL
jgi:transcriptional regulator with XRE-family HTH domain